MKKWLFTAALAGVLSGVAQADGLYAKNSPVLQVSAKDYSSLIEQTNHTSIVEFYAPWCGHCKNLKPAYEKAAKNLAGLAKVAAVNCDDEANKPLCGRLGVQGFPTLKIVKPSSRKGRPAVEDYQGARTAKGIVDAVVSKIPNHVTKVQDADIEEWLTKGASAKAILFTEKGTTAPLMKALAVDFLGSIDFATIRDKETVAVKKYAVSKFPTVVLIPAAGKDPITFEGEIKKEALVGFLAQVASPNPDPAPKKPKATKSKTAKDKSTPISETASASASFSKASKAQEASEFDDFMEARTIVLGDDGPLGSPLPIVEQDEKPMVVKQAAPPIPLLHAASELAFNCLTPGRGNCILVLLPTEDEPDTVRLLASEALASFAEVAQKHRRRRSNLFPFYGVPAKNEAGVILRKLLGLKDVSDLEIIATNLKRKWWKPYEATGYDIDDVERFVDTIRLGEGTKHKLPPAFDPPPKKTSETETPLAAETEPLPVVEKEGGSSTSAGPDIGSSDTAGKQQHDEL